MRSSRRWWAPWPPSSRDRAQLMRLTLVNQYYAPDISPTAQMAASLAEHRADRGDQVTVITGRAGYLEGISPAGGSEEHTSELQSLMRISYAVFCLKKKKHTNANYIKKNEYVL